MTYDLLFHASAEKEWRKLGSDIRKQFAKKLKDRLQTPHVTSAKIRGGDNPRYKIKLRSSGYRLVYEVRDNQVLVLVLAVGKRERGAVYGKASERR